MKSLVILGSTGSIGTQTLQIAEEYLEEFTIAGLAANSSWELLANQAKMFHPQAVALADERFIPQLKEALEGTGIEILPGKRGIEELASIDADLAVVALVGISGLIPTLKAIGTGKNIALANKETLVVGGELVMSGAEEAGVSIIPIDSEHSAIFQCLNGEKNGDVRKIHLTTSGGPFKDTPREELAGMTAKEALNHPTWNMGSKVTIDSSTLMNKGLEVIEAHWLFDLEPEMINVLVHPQSVIHSMVEFIDGSIKAQLSLPDMRLPIQYALTYPDRLPGDYVNTDFLKIGKLTFEPPRTDDFHCLQYAFDAIKSGGTMPAVLNGANEVAVRHFLEGKIGFMDIPRVIHYALEKHINMPHPSLDDLLMADRFSREMAFQAVARFG